MPSATQLPTATILQFPTLRLAENRLTTQDRIEVLTWEAAIDPAGSGRMVIHHRQEDDDPEIGDFISIYRSGSAWASWGLARRGRIVSVWSCGTGADLGDFATMREALAAIPMDTCVQAKVRA